MSEPTKLREFWITFEPFYVNPLGQCPNVMRYVASYPHEYGVHFREVSPEIDAAISDMRTMLVKWQTSDLPVEALCVLSNKVIELYDNAVKRGAV